MISLDAFEAHARTFVNIPDRRPVWEWAGGSNPDHSDANVRFGNTTAFRGAYDVANVPWTKGFLDACDNPLVREVTFVAPPQDSGKTKAAEVYLAKVIATSPANCAFNTSTNVKAARWYETRWEQMITATPAIKDRLSANRHKKKKERIVFRDGTYLLIQGAETEGNRASDSVEIQVNDECYLWDAPWLNEMHDRTGAYRDTRKIINISVGGKKGGELHSRFLAGNQLEWMHLCPACRAPFAYVFNQKDPRYNIRFDIGAAVFHADGRLDLREFERTIYCECPHCKHRMTFDRDRLAAMNREGVYTPMNPDADPSIVSLHVNSFAIGREPWVKILEPWVRLHIRGGIFAPEILKEFINKKLAEWWDEKPFVISTELKLSPYTRADVLKPKAWPDEIFRVMCGDNQHGRKGDVPHRWFGCFAFTKSGRVRLVDAGRINEWDDLRKKQIELGVPDPVEEAPGPWTMIDRRYDGPEVDTWCAKYKWYGSVGYNSDEFVHPPWSPMAGTRQLFTEPRLMDIGYGGADGGRTYSTYFLWASQKIQDLLAQLRAAQMIEFPMDSGQWCPELATHMNSHRQFIETNRRNQEVRIWKRIGDTPDHLYDITCQAIVIGCMAGIYQMPTNTEETKNGTETRQ